MNLKSVCVISQSSEVICSFTLSSNNESILRRNKYDADVLQFEKLLGNHQTKLQLSATKLKCSQYDVSSTLKLNEKRIYNTSNHQEKNEVMLNPLLLPRCTLKNVQLVKCQLSPSSSSQKQLIASLSSYGSIDISQFEHDKTTSRKKLKSIAELCDIRKTSFSLSNSYMKLSKLKEIIDELSFTNFDWCPTILGTTQHIAAVTKTNEIVFYAINPEGESVVECSEQLEGVVCELKWLVSPDGHFLIVANNHGHLVRYLIEMTEGEMVSGLMKVNEIQGILKIPVSYIHAEQIGNAVLLVCTKAHSLEIFLINKSSVKSITKYIGMSITGLTSVSNLASEFLIATMNNTINYMKLSIAKNDLKIEVYEKVEVDTSSDPLKFGVYGIIASRNKALVFVSLYPQIVTYFLFQTDSNEILMKFLML